MITLKHTIECWGAIYQNVWYNITTKIDFKFTRPELPVDAVLRSRRCHEVGRVAAVDDKPSHVEDEEEVDVEQCSDGEDAKDSSEPPTKKVIHWFAL